MRVAILCEYSGIVRDAFIRRGHDAISCDLLPTERPGPHYQGDVFHFLNDVRYSTGFDLVICHPPCTRLCNSGVLRLYKDGKKANGIDPVKWQEMIDGAIFFRSLLHSNCDRLCAENPVMHGYATEIIGMKQTQIIQPYNFNEDASKATGLWLKNLPPLVNIGYFHPRMVCRHCGHHFVYGTTDYCTNCTSMDYLLPRWSNQTDSGQNRLAPGETRGKDRAKTYEGIAEAMATQWG